MAVTAIRSKNVESPTVFIFPVKDQRLRASLPVSVLITALNAAYIGQEHAGGNPLNSVMKPDDIALEEYTPQTHDNQSLGRAFKVHRLLINLCRDCYG